MTGDDRVRFCGECKKHVYNLSAMTQREAETLLRETNAQVCTRFYQRLDGTILTQDCPLGLRVKAARVTRRVSVAVSGLLGFAATALAQMPQKTEPLVQVEADTRPVLSGVVKDPLGEVISNAFISVTDIKTGISIQLRSDERGEFRTSLEVGNYIVTVTHPGFASFKKSFAPQSKEKVLLDVTLLVGTMGSPVFVQPKPSRLPRWLRW